MKKELSAGITTETRRHGEMSKSQKVKMSKGERASLALLARLKNPDKSRKGLNGSRGLEVGGDHHGGTEARRERGAGMGDETRDGIPARVGARRDSRTSEGRESRSSEGGGFQARCFRASAIWRNQVQFRTR
jgi:hypothetical protein